MSATRSTNLQPQQRLDISSIKLIESASNYDLDLLAGISIAGKLPVVFKGLSINAQNVISSDPTTLSVQVANSVIWHYLASESGTVFQIGSTEPDQLLSSINPNVVGTFASGTNYIGLDLYKTADSSTSDTVAFLDNDTKTEFTQTIPLARTIKYRLIITTQPFSVMTNILPIAKVFVLNGVVSQITDARNMMFRLGSGGDSPNASNTFSWGARTENPITLSTSVGSSPFVGEDKNIDSLKSWVNAMMTTIWEIRGGNYWYSNQHRDDVKLAYGPTLLSNGDNVWFLNGTVITAAMTRSGSTVTVPLNNHPFVVGSKFELSSTDTTNFPSGQKVVTNVPDGNNFQYQETGAATTSGAGSTIVNTVAISDLRMLYENSSPTYFNTIQNSSFVVPEGSAIYVDLVREANLTVTPFVAPLTTLGSSVIPGRRMILAWRNNNAVFSRDRSYEVGRTFSPATTLALGLVKINATAETPLAPVVPVIQAGGFITVTGSSLASLAGSTFTGFTGTTGGTAALTAVGGGATVSGFAFPALAATGGLAVSDGVNDGAGVSAATRGSFASLGRVTGSGIGGGFTGASGFNNLLNYLNIEPNLRNSGALVIGGTGKPGLVALGGNITAASGVMNYTGGIGAYIRGASGAAGIINEVNGTGIGLGIINNKYGAVPVLPTNVSQYMYNDNDSSNTLVIQSDNGHLGTSVALTRLNLANGILMSLTNQDASTTTGAANLLVIDNSGAASGSTAIPLRIIGKDAATTAGITLESWAGLKLGSSNEKISYVSPPVYNKVIVPSDATYLATSWNWLPGAGSPEGALFNVSTATSISSDFLRFKLELPVGATLTAVRAALFNTTASVSVTSNIIKNNASTRPGGAGTSLGSGSTAATTGGDQLANLNISGSYTIAAGDYIIVQIGFSGVSGISAGGIGFYGLNVTYSMPTITGAM